MLTQFNLHPRLGRQNPLYYEVLDGLSPGEKVIISGYDLFGKNEHLKLRYWNIFLKLLKVRGQRSLLQPLIYLAFLCV